MRRLIAVLSFAALLAGAAPVLGQEPDPAVVAARMDAQRAAMAKLSRLDGEWRGEAWVDSRTGPRRIFVQAERVGSMLDGTVKVIEGRGFEEGKLTFNAFAVISYDPDKKAYSMRTNTWGYHMDVPVEPTADGFIWTIPAGPGGQVRYTAVIKDGTWTEWGEYIPTGGKGRKFMEMTLKRLGDTKWPSEGALGPK
ncbi:MAG TPA: DUF1579 domain-containing protein [Caulobacter sp.]|nr:DUF1579 domain-containing protein [Caulobacter sp.]